MMRNNTRPLATSLALLTLVVVVGCGRSPPAVERVPTFPVHGRLTINGAPAAGATVKFYAGNQSGPLPTAIVRDDGSFSASYYEVDDGAPAGEYKLLILWMETPPGGGLAQDRLQGRFADPQRPAATCTIVSGTNTLPAISLHVP